MTKRKIGRSDLEVTPFALGGNVFGWTIDEEASFAVLDAFVGEGCNLIDTADVYSRWKQGNEGGESETIIGNWMKKRKNRNRLVIATKVGGDMGQGKKDISRNYILKAVDASLRRLQTDHIDLYQTHWDVPGTPVEETLSAYERLVKEGKVRYIGASNFSAESLRESIAFSEANGLPRYESYQPEYNLYTRQAFEEEMERLCLDKGIGVINYYSLAAGFLTGKYRSEADAGKSARGEGNKKYLNERGFKILDALDNVAIINATEPATIAMAWLMHRPVVTAPIASATSVEQLQSLGRAVYLPLDPEEIKILDEASAY